MMESSMWTKYSRASNQKATLVEHGRLIGALEASDRGLCASEMVRHRYSTESGLPPERPGPGSVNLGPDNCRI